MVEGFTNTDKLLVCLAIILFITIVWTILIGIMYKMSTKNIVTKKKIIFEDDDDDDIKVKEDNNKKVVKKETTKIVKKETNKNTNNESKSDSAKVVKEKKETKKSTKKKPTKKKSKKRESKTVEEIAEKEVPELINLDSDKQTYVQVKFFGTDKNLIYVAPDNILLSKGEKVRVITDEGKIRSATVVKGNYRREKYKTYEYQVLELVQ